MMIQQQSFLRNKAYLAAAFTHFCIDILNNGRTVLIALLAVSLKLKNSQLGLYLLLYNVGSALSQPLFGLLADRFGARWLVVGGLGWMTLFYGVAAVAHEQWALLAVTIASLGSGAFHPGGAKIASQVSQQKRTQATALFFMAGQLGLFLGPILAGNALELFGRPGYLLLIVLAVAALGSSWQWLVDDHVFRPAPFSPNKTSDKPRPELVWQVVLAVVVIIIAYNTVSFAAQNFAPKLFAEQGYPASYVGWIAGLFMLGSALGGLVGGNLADRYGNRPVIMLALVGVILPTYFYIPAGDPWRFMLLILAGFFGGMPHSLLVLMVQGLLPGRRALASGLALGFMFTCGAIGSYILGLIADRVGLDIALQGVILLPIVAIGVAGLLPAGKNEKMAG